jgi:hypothetical protein
MQSTTDFTINDPLLSSVNDDEFDRMIESRIEELETKIFPPFSDKIIQLEKKLLKSDPEALRLYSGIEFLVGHSSFLVAKAAFIAGMAFQQQHHATLAAFFNELNHPHPRMAETTLD